MENSVARMVLQQCIAAKLKVEHESVESFVEINKGMVVYVCFLKGATQQTVDKMVNTVMTVKLSKSDSGQLVSVSELPGSILIVPQATLGGKLKGKRMQYHSNVAKETGFHLYNRFVSELKKALQQKASDEVVKSGIYGNLQVLHVNTNGPFTHLVEVT